MKNSNNNPENNINRRKRRFPRCRSQTSSSDTTSLCSTSSSEWDPPHIPPQKYQPKHFRICPSRVRPKPRDGFGSKYFMENLCILRVSNLDKTLEESEIRELFEVFGEIESVKLRHNLRGASTGTCDILFTLRESAMNALKEINRRFNRTGKGVKATIIHRKNVTGNTKEK